MDDEQGDVRPEPGTPFTGGGALVPRLSRPQVTARTVVVVLATALAFLGALWLLYQLRQIVRWTVIAVFLAVAPSVIYALARFATGA